MLHLTKNLHNKYGYKVFLIHPQNKIWNSLATFVAERYGMLAQLNAAPQNTFTVLKAPTSFHHMNI